MSDRPIRKLPQCEDCRNSARSVFLLCAMHPYGVEDGFEQCPDHDPDPNALEDEWWEPQQFGSYNRETITSPVDRLTKAQQLELLLWHPLFTGLCPQCRHPFPPAANYVYWDCPECGWKDDTV
ncbi:hypothetical protein [Leptolyngbya ohadii]|uniref:hypothetical protein n=1 Tax=Leptolyngbya ohadii TaxID=1962290 RepID=UPI0019D4225E|nr:hypothetical protein [Leptolyngbya ohadii]